MLFGSIGMSPVRTSTAGCALFPERILRCRLVIRLYYKAFAETRSCLPVSIRSRRKKNVYTQRRKRRDATLRRLDRFGLGRSKTLLEHALNRAKELGFSRVTLETASVLKEAVKLYQKYNFRPFPAQHLATRCDQAFYLDFE